MIKKQRPIRTTTFRLLSIVTFSAMLLAVAVLAAPRQAAFASAGVTEFAAPSIRNPQRSPLHHSSLVTTTYSYDANGRLTGADYGSSNIGYTYDQNGNMTQRQVNAAALLPSLSLTKQVDQVTPQTGSQVNYTVVVANSGDGNATGVVVLDTLSAGLNFTGPVTLDPPQAGATLAQTGADLPTLAAGLTITAGQQITLTFPATIGTALSTGAVLTNTASVTSAEVSTPHTHAVTLTVVTAPKSGNVDPVTGGSVTVDDNSVSLDFAGDTVTTTTTITVTPILAPNNSTGSFTFAGRAFTVVATDSDGNEVTQFKQSFTLTVTYDDSDWQSAGIANESELNLYFWNGTQWEALLPCTGCEHKEGENQIIIQLDHLTEFALMDGGSSEETRVYLPIILKN